MEEKSCGENLFCGLNKPANIKSMSDLEKKHTPVIESPSRVKKEEVFEVSVEIGKLLKHPNEIGHFIQWIELYCGDTFLTRVDLTPEFTEPKITVPVRLTHAHPLRAIGRCNLHGLWENTKEINVE
ncbi:MAG: class II SORL domain-containing protein [Candidatus Hydrothermarchaeota archaeon]